MLQYLERHSAALLEGTTVVELGSGIGLLGTNMIVTTHPTPSLTRSPSLSLSLSTRSRGE